ncbi:MAG: hypothetical protein ABEJ56_05470 [Candidatus Nanohaloarchaea archaeon]
MKLFPFPEVRDKQDELMEASWKAIKEENSLVAHAPTGLGKCVSGDSQVLTGQGIGRIEQLESAESIKCNSFDNILSSDISRARLIKKKREELREITTYTGREVKVTKDHKILRLKKGEVEWVETRKVDEGDYIASPRSIDLPEVEFSLTLDDINENNVRVSVSPDLEKVLRELKNELEMDDSELSEYLDIPGKNFTSMRKSRPVKACHIEDVIHESVHD